MARLVAVDEEKKATKARAVEIPQPGQYSTGRNIAGAIGKGALAFPGFIGDMVAGALQAPPQIPDTGIVQEIIRSQGLPVASDYPTAKKFRMDPSQALQTVANSMGVPTDYNEQFFPARATDFVVSGLLGGGATARSGAAKELVKEGVPALRAYAGQFGREAGMATAAAASTTAAEKLTEGSSPFVRTAAQLAGPMLPAITALGMTGLVRGGMRGFGEEAQTAFSNNAADFKAATGAEATVSQAAQNARTVGVERGLSMTGSGNFPLWTAGKEQAIRMKAKVASVMGGDNTSKTAAGNAVDQGLFGKNGYVERGNAQAESLYDQMWQKFPADSRVPLTESSEFLDSFVARYGTDPEFKSILGDGFFEKLKTAVTENKTKVTFDAMGTPVTRPGPTIATLRAVRSDIGRLIGSPRSVLPGDAPTGDLKTLYAVLTKDIEAGAKAQGQDAYDAFKAADGFYKEYRGITDDVLSKIEGKSGKDLFLAIEKKDDKTLTAILGALQPDERKLVAQTVINNLGKAAPSAQRPTTSIVETLGAEPANEIFNPQTFLTNWNKLTPTTRTILVPDTATRQSLDKFSEQLFKASEGSRVIFNTSGTAGSGALAAQVIAFISGVATGNVALAGKVALGTGGTIWAAKKITDPKFVKWLSQANQIPRGALLGHIARLGSADFGSPEENAMRDQFVKELRAQLGN